MIRSWSLLAAGLILAGPWGPVARVCPGKESDLGRSGPDGTELGAAVSHVDRLIRDQLAQLGTQLNAEVDDETFVRRAYLDVIGRIPTAVETREFVESSGRSKRAELIDRLLDSPGHVSDMFNYWADILRLKTRLARTTSGEPYMHWLRQALAENMPYDQFVASMLIAEGPAHARDNGATGYYLRDREMPEDNMSNTMRVFLGTRMECAQCHDHPFDKWTQMQFFEMAAFTGGIQYRDESLDRADESLRQMGREIRKGDDQMAKRALRRVVQRVNTGISGSGTGLTRLPDNYEYDDAEPESWVKAHALFGDDPGLSVEDPETRMQRARKAPKKQRKQRLRAARRNPEVGSREAYADWLTSPDNPRFTRVIANRIWKKTFGRGLIEPVDDLTDDTQATNEELLSYLERLLVDLGYDLNAFQRILLNTRAYQSVAEPDGTALDAPVRGPVMRRMTAEQIWDSLLTLVVFDLDGTLSKPGDLAEPVYAEYEEFIDQTGEELAARIELEQMRYTDPDAYREVQQAERAGRQAVQAEARKLRKQITRARKSGQKRKLAELSAQLEEMGFAADRNSKRRRRPANANLRASDLSQPAPAGHFLARFGQSDRDQIETSHIEPNVPQVLALVNGFVEEKILGNGNAIVMRSLERARKPRAKVVAAYMSILNRTPEKDEVAAWIEDFEQHGPEAIDDLVWTLVNSHEFRYVR